MWWLGQGQNATAVQAIAAVLVAVVTVWYAFLTHWIMKATRKQASATLQPELAMAKLDESQDKGIRTIVIENKSARPIVFLNTVIYCRPMGHDNCSRRLDTWDDRILSAGDSIRLPLDFTSELEALRSHTSTSGAVVVVSDLSRYVAITYTFEWNVRYFVAKVGMPFRVRWRYRLRPLGWRYYRFAYGLRDVFKKSE